MPFERWDDLLVHEHELIERAMAVLKRGLENLDKAVHEPRPMSRALDFLSQFGDRLHNAKEERFLFPLMEQHGIPVQNGPLGVMLMEHEAERKLLGEMSMVLPRLAEATPEERDIFRQTGLDYLKVRAEHIWKENDVLYAMGRKVLSTQDNAYLLGRFAALDRDTYGMNAHEHYERMVLEAEASGAPTRLVEHLNTTQLHALLEALPMEITFVDAEDTVAYFNRLDKPKIFPRTRSVIGRKVLQCHPAQSADKVERIVQGFKDGTLDKADFWIDFRDEKVLIRYFPVRDDQGIYLGVLEVTQEIGWIQQLEGQKRLLD